LERYAGDNAPQLLRILDECESIPAINSKFPVPSASTKTEMFGGEVFRSLVPIRQRDATGPSFDALLAGERAASSGLDGRSIFGWERDLQSKRKAKLS
jgi:hypothetical protein